MAGNARKLQGSKAMAVLSAVKFLADVLKTVSNTNNKGLTFGFKSCKKNCTYYFHFNCGRIRSRWNQNQGSSSIKKVWQVSKSKVKRVSALGCTFSVSLHLITHWDHLPFRFMCSDLSFLVNAINPILVKVCNNNVCPVQKAVSWAVHKKSASENGAISRITGGSWVCIIGCD